MFCSEYDSLERAHGKAIEEANRLRLFGAVPRSACSLDELVGAEVSKTVLDAARSKHLRNCKNCVRCGAPR
jgi:hypothetical protein